MNKINIAFDMETSDPDDVFTLCLLAHHPCVNLVSVTVTPGSKHQIGLVKYG
jgi:pyrimidine-specific ribonucleoside hydrolase